MTDLVDKTVGAVAMTLTFQSGKLVFSAGDASLGVSAQIVTDANAIVASIQGLLDGKYPNEKGAIDLVLGLIKSAIAAQG